MTREQAFELVAKERQQQILVHGHTLSDDEELCELDWCAVVAHELGDLADSVLSGSASDIQRALVKVAAVAVAALEATG